MVEEHISVKEMWHRYLMHLGHDPLKAKLKHASWHFCDNRKDADSLAELVKQGIKKATTSLLYFYELENEKLPKAGDLSIITNWQGEAQCIIETKKVTLQPFCEVTEDFAQIEGEGDKSLQYWQDVHRHAFTRQMQQYDNEFSEEMLVVCEEFEMVWHIYDPL